MANLNDLLFSLELPERRSLHDIILGIADSSGLNGESGIYDVLNDIFPNIRDGRPPTLTGEIAGGAGRIASGQVGSRRGGGLNTYPFGVPSDWYPDMVGICAGKQYTFADILSEIKKHAKIAAQRWPGRPKFTLIITDKWDGPRFTLDELEFLKFSLIDNRLFIFILVTNYGAVRIPMLAESFSELQDVQAHNRRLIKDLEAGVFG